MLQAMLAGVASIKAQQTRMNVIGNNLANVNTTAYKGSRVTFQDMLAQTIRGATKPTGALGGTNAIQFGLGVLVGGTDVNNGQGSLNSTSRPTDFAIQGNGYFVVSDGSSLSYTRDGAFNLDANGDLVHSATGQKMTGWTANPATGIINTNKPLGPAAALNIPVGARTAVQQTTNVTWTGNLDSRVFTSGGPPASTAGTIRVYDALGTQHDMDIVMTQGATANSWNWSITPKNGDTVKAGTGSGTITFDPATGKMLTGTPGLVSLVPPVAAGTPNIDMTMDLSTISQLATSMQVQASNQNGFAPGSLSSFSVDTSGVITGLYTNGLTRSLGQIAMAIFPNTSGLEREGNNLWRDTNNSGVPVIGAPQTGGRGLVNSGFLEQSNVDISNEFTDLIITQRGFQANTKIVTTVDEMLQELISMKR